MALSLVSVNIEWDKHLDTVLPFLKEVQPDVVFVMELLEPDIPVITEAIGGSCFYTPMMRMPSRRGILPEGIGIISRLPMTEMKALQYSGSVGASYVHSDEPETWDKDYELRALCGATVEKEGISYKLFATHFNWTIGGESTEAQREAMARMLVHLSREESFVLAGDFNAPRGRATFAMLAERYKDNIPAEYETSLDPVLHTKAGRPLPYMVDGLFTTPEYTAKDVRLQFGVSDHAAIVASIEKTA